MPVGKSYRERYNSGGGNDPLIVRFCDREMDLWKVWDPKYETIYDEWEDLKTQAAGSERARSLPFRSGPAVCPPTGGAKLPLKKCGCEIWVNETTIDLELDLAEFEGTLTEDFMPVLGCPGCNQEFMEYTGIKDGSKSADLIHDHYIDHDVKRLVKRVKRHKNELFRFLEYSARGELI